MTQEVCLFVIGIKVKECVTMCDEAVDDSLATLKLIPDRFVTSKMIKNLFTALYADENILYFNEDSGNVVFKKDFELCQVFMYNFHAKLILKF